MDKITLNEQTGTAYTAVLADAGKLIQMNNAGANTLTVPANASVAYDTGTILLIEQAGAGATSVAGDTGVSVNGVSAGSLTISAQYDSVALIKTGTDAWHAFGPHGGVS